ncbi:MAG: hypothetical protein FWC72_01835 [Oscillospiraceae bacterium]|nr:hypothetical protein [Oscillospiraceae bacterium]
MSKENFDPNQAQEFAASRAGALEDLVRSKDGQRVKAMMGADADRLKQAVQSGDMQALKQGFDKLMATEEGSRLISQIQGMMKK